MEKSIETIWKEGFLDSNALIAPKINNLYNQKSTHVIDKFKRLAKANLVGLSVASVVIFMVALMAKIPLIGSLIALTLLWIVVVGWRQSKMLNQISTNQSSYQYLQAFDEWLQGCSTAYQRLYRFVYPMLFVLAFLGAFYANIGGNQSHVERMIASGDVTLVLGVPAVVWITVFVLAGLSGVFRNKIYRFDIDLIYGRVLHKIHELLHDMKELSEGA